MIRCKHAATALISLLLLGVSLSAGAFEFVRDDVYASVYFSTTINHYTSDGVYVDSLTLPATYGNQVHGLAFGPEGLLYVVTFDDGVGFTVVAVDANGTAKAVYHSPMHMQASSLDDGRIAFGADGTFYVTAQSWLTAFQIGSANGSVIYTQNFLTNVAVLPSGNLLLLAGFQLDEITSSGSLVRNILKTRPPGISDIDLSYTSGMAYDADTNAIFVSNGSNFGDFYSYILTIDESTGHIINSYSYPYAKGLLLTSNKRLFLGSLGWPPVVTDEHFSTLVARLNQYQTDFAQFEPVYVPALCELNCGILDGD